MACLYPTSGPCTKKPASAGLFLPAGWGRAGETRQFLQGGLHPPYTTRAPLPLGMGRAEKGPRKAGQRVTSNRSSGTYLGSKITYTLRQASSTSQVPEKPDGMTKRSPARTVLALPSWSRITDTPWRISQYSCSV